MKTREEINSDFRNGEALIEYSRGRIINQYDAKRIYQLCKGCFIDMHHNESYSIYEERLTDTRALVIMEKSINNVRNGEKIVFLIDGEMKKDQLNMC